MGILLQKVVWKEPLIIDRYTYIGHTNMHEGRGLMPSLFVVCTASATRTGSSHTGHAKREGSELREPRALSLYRSY